MICWRFFNKFWRL